MDLRGRGGETRKCQLPSVIARPFLAKVVRTRAGFQSCLSELHLRFGRRGEGGICMTKTTVISGVGSGCFKQSLIHFLMVRKLMRARILQITVGSITPCLSAVRGRTSLRGWPVSAEKVAQLLGGGCFRVSPDEIAHAFIFKLVDWLRDGGITEQENKD